MLILALLLLLSTARAVDCGCGYTLLSSLTPNSSSRAPPAQLLFTDALETDFLHVYALPNYTSSSNQTITDFGWQAQAYNVSPTDARGPYGKAAAVNNVVVNPVANQYDWVGGGINGGDPGLQVLVRGQDKLLQQDDGSELVRVGEMAAIRQDVVYGSFRVGMKMSDVPGTCAAFFWYRNNTSELDLEFLSREVNPVNTSSPANLNLVIQTPLSASHGFDASDTPYYQVIPLPFLASAGYHEYRIDWLPTSVTFFVDGTPLWSMYDEAVIPDAPGHLILNHWSNGDPKWSGGPPVDDAVLTVSYVKAYFNSSDGARQQNFSKSCAAQGAESCAIQEADWSVGIDPSSNASGRTPFVTPDPGWSSANGHKSGAAAKERVMNLLITAVMVSLGIRFLH